MINLLVVLLIILISFSVWNLVTLRNIKRYNYSKVNLSDDHYYELKYKLEYLTTIVIVVLSVGGYFGYHWFEDIKIDAAKNLANKTKVTEQKFDSINFKLNVTDYKVNDFNDKIIEYQSKAKSISDNQNKLVADQNIIRNSLTMSKDSLTGLSNKIDKINSKNILKQNFYVVRDIQYVLDKTDGNKFFFKDLITTTGDKLPQFEKIPFVSISTGDGIELWISELTKESITLDESRTRTDLKVAKINLMFSEQ